MTRIALAILLLSTTATAMRLDPLVVSAMVDDRRPLAVPAVIRRGGDMPKVIPVGLRPWPGDPSTSAQDRPDITPPGRGLGDDWGKGAPRIVRANLREALR
jgi:hypothetical protein